MTFQDFIKKGNVRQSTSDPALVQSLLLTAENDLLFLEPLEINQTSTRKIMSNYYDILRSIIEAIAAKEGYKVYSHEAFTDYLKEKNETILSEKFDRYRKIRNNINYYGKNISVEEVKEYKEDIKLMIQQVQQKFFSKKDHTTNKP